MLERDFENKFVRYAQSLGHPCLKLRIDGVDGFPDRTVLTASGIFFLEFKRPGGVLRPQQRKWKKILTGLGFTFGVVESYTDAVAVLEQYLKGHTNGCQ
jgi:hypothetical protein